MENAENLIVPNDDQKEIIKKTVQELVEKLSISSEVEIKESESEEARKNLVCNIQTKESSYLIGQYGVNLQALQHIARILTRKKIEGKINFILDVNFYRQEKNGSIILLAQNAASQALAEKRAIVLRPMSAYERRLVHLELSKDDKIRTESTGEGEDRRIVIKPADLA